MVLHRAIVLPLLLASVAPEGWLGVYFEPERDEPVVAEVIPSSPADRAGLQIGDVLVAVGGETAPRRERLRALLAAAKPGDELALVVRRGGAEQRLVVKLGDRPDASTPKPAVAPPKPSRPAAPPAPSAEAAPPRPAAGPSRAPAEAAPAAPAPAPGDAAAIEAELAALRAELAALRRQLEALRRANGKE